MSKITPYENRIAVQPKEQDQKKGGIIIPDTAKDKPMMGEVIAVGSGTSEHKMDLKVGQTVLYGKYSGTEVEWEGKKILIMKTTDVLAIIQE